MDALGHIMFRGAPASGVDTDGRSDIFAATPIKPQNGLTLGMEGGGRIIL